MQEFVGEEIEVEKAKSSPRPVRFTWRGKVHEVAEVLEQHVDIGFGDAPPKSRKWYARRHRRYYTVRDSEGRVFEMYLDYANRRKQTWWLVKMWAGENNEGHEEETA